MIKINDFFDKKRIDVTFNDFIFDENKAVKDQLDNLKEDLYQASFGNHIIDIGWYPSFKQDGKFIISIIKDYDWQAPILQYKTAEIDKLIEFIKNEVSSYIIAHS